MVLQIIGCHVAAISTNLGHSPTDFLTLPSSQHNHFFTTELSSSFSMINSIRGGAGVEHISVDLEKAGIRLQSLDEYAVIASILLGAVIDVYISVDTRDRTERKDRLATYVHAVGTTVSFMSGMYAILLFSLVSLYAKTALGTGNDAAYLSLLDTTAALRYSGFQAFVLCLVSFEVALVANVFLTFQGPSRWIYSVACAISTIVCLRRFKEIIMLATRYIFS